MTFAIGLTTIMIFFLKLNSQAETMFWLFLTGQYLRKSKKLGNCLTESLKNHFGM